MKIDYQHYFDLRQVKPPLPSECGIPGSVKDVLPKNRDAGILDIGCGYGVLLQGLKNDGYTNAHGIDISSQAVDLCVKSGLNVSLIDNIVTYADGYAGAKYDFIVMSHVLEHIPKQEIIPTLAIIRQKLLSEKGILYIGVPNAQSNTGAYWAYEDFTHETLFTGGSLIFVLMAAGFKELEFLDPEGLGGLSRREKYKKKFFLYLYKKNLAFWNWVTSSYFHAPSPRIFTYELKIIARQ